MAAYLVRIPVESGGVQTFNGATAAIVNADSAAAALQIAQCLDPAPNNKWTGASVEEIAAESDFENWTLRVRVFGHTSEIDFTVVGGSSGTLDTMGADMATALNTHADIANAAYAVATQVLTVAGAADGLGDLIVDVQLIPPAATYPGGVHVAAMIASQVDGGDPGDALSVTFVADTVAVPKGYALLKQV